MDVLSPFIEGSICHFECNHYWIAGFMCYKYTTGRIPF